MTGGEAAGPGAAGGGASAGGYGSGYGGGYGRPQPFRFERIGAVLNALGTIWIFVLLVLVDADILGRELLGMPVRGTIEIVGLSIVGIVFLQLPNALWAGRFTRAELLLDALAVTRPRLASAAQGVLHLLGALALALVCHAVWPEFLRAWELGDYVGAIADFTAPTWPVRLVMVAGSALTALTFLLLAVADFQVAAGLRPPGGRHGAAGGGRR